MKKILVTGGAGFIGSNLCEQLLNEGHHVICMDNLFCSSKKNIERFADKKNFEFIKHDINQPLPAIKGIGEIYNLACPASPIWYQKDPVATLRTNTLGLINVLDFARKEKCRVLQASTSEVYGDPDEHPQRESYRGNVNTLGPRACYDEGKRSAETLMMDYHREYKVDVKIIRIFNTYGPYMAENDGRVVSNFIIQALNNAPITIYGTGEQTRSFQYIDDLLSGMTKMMDAPNFIGPVNLGNPIEYTVKQLAEEIIFYTGSKSKIKYNSLPIDDPRKRRPDITLAQEKLHWAPKVALKEGLLKTIAYFEKQI
jgi:UDP-glucuronate decarboxylase